MYRESSPPFKEPNTQELQRRLQEYGLAIEYFPAFVQAEHDFHSHGFIEILYVVSGSFEQIAADTLYEESSGSMTILNYNQYHSLRTTEGAVELYNIYLDPQKYPMPQLPSPLDQRLLSLIPLHPELGNRLNRIVHIETVDNRMTTGLLQLLYQKQNSEHEGRDRSIFALFEVLLIELASCVDTQEGNLQSTSDWRVDRVILHLENNLRQRIRLEELCELSGMKKSNLCKQFKSHTGMSISSYLNQRRLALSLQRLRSSDMKILSVALESGFSDISTFNRLFKEAFGCTPSEYRKTLIH